jgi:hypothetical protein
MGADLVELLEHRRELDAPEMHEHQAPALGRLQNAVEDLLRFAVTLDEDELVRFL